MTDHKPDEPKPSDDREEPRSPDDPVPTETPGESEAHPS
jgi:hypothetical protein